MPVVSTISILSISFLQIKKKSDIAIHQSKKFGTKKLLRRWSDSFQDPPYLSMREPNHLLFKSLTTS